MAISDKLIYLNTTKGKIKDSINLTGAGITNDDTFRSYAVKLRDGLVQVLNDNGETLYNNFPKVSGTGSNISLSNTLEAPMRNKMFKGNTLQNGTPTPDNPVDIQCVEGIQNVEISGKNLFQLKTPDYTGHASWNGYGSITYNLIDNGFNFSKRYSSISFEYDNLIVGQQYTISYNAISNINCTAGIGVNVYRDSTASIKPNKTQNITTTLQRFSFTFIATEENRIAFNSGDYENLANLTISDIQLEVGNEATSYEPYKVPQNYEINLEGKNLCNVEFENGTYDGAENPVSSSTRLRSKTPIYLKTGTYTISASNTNQAIIFLSDSGTVGTYSKPFSSFTDLPLTFTITNDKYILIIFSENTATNIQIEKGTTATSYVPYRSPIKLYNGDYITGTPDNWSIYRENGEIVLNGSSDEIWTFNNDKKRVATPLINGKIFGNIKANMFTMGSNYNDTTINTIYIYANDYCWIYLDGTQFTDLSSWKTYLSSHNLEILYKLATPTTEQITDEYLISQLNALYNAKSYNGQTNITVDGQLSMILEVSALKDEI